MKVCNRVHKNSKKRKKKEKMINFNKEYKYIIEKHMKSITKHFSGIIVFQVTHFP